MLSRALDWNARLLFPERRFLGGIAVYLVFLFALRVALFPGASEDDAEQLYYAQIFAWGYKDNQPPLYTWLVIVFERVFGVGVLAVEAVKFLCFFAIYAFMHLAARVVLKQPTMTVLAGLSPVGLYYVGWDSVMNYSHSILMMGLLAATLYLLLRLGTRARVVDYVVLGAVVGLGILAKYNYALFLVPFLAACTVHPELRRRILTWQMAVALLLAGIIIAPHVHWLIAHPPPGPDQSLPPVGKLRSLTSVFGAALVFASPLLVLFALILPRAFLPLSLGARTALPYRRVFELYFFLLAAIVIAAILVFRESEARVHWLAVLLPFPIYVLMRAEALAVSGPRVKWLAGALVSLALLVPAAVVANYVVAPRWCKKCNFFVPYAELARQLRAAGFTGGTVVAYDYPNQLTGNLRIHFPQARFYSTRHRVLDLPALGESGTCLLIWNTTLGPDTATAIPKDMPPRVFRLFEARVSMDVPLNYADLPIPRSRNRHVRFAFVIVAGENQGRCR